MTLFNYQLSGGLAYHFRALTYGQRWSSFRSWVSAHLEAWNPSKKNLVLVGPSGGWSLPTNFLKRFSQITAYDLDPFAKPIFQSRHRMANLEWRNEDFFAPDGSCLAEHIDKESAVLFCNVLGQIGIVYRKSWQQRPEFEDSFINNFTFFLKSQSHWASYHDIYSLAHPTNIEIKRSQFKSLEHFADCTKIRETYIDHLSQRYFLKPHEELQLWRLSPRKSHLMGWQSSLLVV